MLLNTFLILGRLTILYMISYEIPFYDMHLEDLVRIFGPCIVSMWYDCSNFLISGVLSVGKEKIVRNASLIQAANTLTVKLATNVSV